MGGRDLVAGGTWLAVDDGGTVCAVTNRHPGTGKPEPPDPTRRSRGEIPLSLAHRRRRLGTSRRASRCSGRAATTRSTSSGCQPIARSSPRSTTPDPVRVIDLQPGRARAHHRRPRRPRAAQGGDAPCRDGLRARGGRWTRRDPAANARAPRESRVADGSAGRCRMHSRRCVRHGVGLERRRWVIAV